MLFMFLSHIAFVSYAIRVEAIKCLLHVLAVRTFFDHLYAPLDSPPRLLYPFFHVVFVCCTF